MEQEIVLTVEDGGLRLDKLLADWLPDVSRSAVYAN